jgi:hypothetical protein
MKGLKGKLNPGETVTSIDSFIAEQKDKIKGIGRTDEYRDELKLRIDNLAIE